MTYSKVPSGKSPKNSVGVRSDDGMLSLRLPRAVSREVFGKNQYIIFLGLPDTEKNRKLAHRKAEQMTDDISYGCFDPSLAKYEIGKRTQLTLIQGIKPKSEPALMEIWDKWIERGELIWEVKTKAKYKAFTKHIRQIPADLLSLDRASDVRDFLIKTCPLYTAKEILTRISAATKDALKNGLVKRNPFEGMASEIKIQPKSEEEIVDPFSTEERDLVISAYENHKHYKKYAALVKVMFWTGARPSEVIGLKWSSISEHFDAIHIREAIVYCEGKLIHKDSTKTRKSRRIPVSQQKLKKLLLELKTESTKPNDLVFHRGDGKPIDYRQFVRSWKGGHNGSKKYHGIVTEMVEKGILSHYRSPYQCRHTFATLAVENNMPLHDVAKVMGNSTRVCSENYVKARRSLIIPDF